MKSFGLASQGSLLKRLDDGAIFVVLLRVIDRAYVQRTLCIRSFSTWLRQLPGGRFGGVAYDDVLIGEKLSCTEHPGVRFVVVAKDNEVREIILVQGIVATDPALWELAIPK